MLIWNLWWPRLIWLCTFKNVKCIRQILYSFGEARDVKYPLQIIYILPILFQWDVFERLEFTPHLIRLYMLYIKLYVGNLHDICTYLTHVFSSECFWKIRVYATPTLNSNCVRTHLILNCNRFTGGLVNKTFELVKKTFMKSAQQCWGYNCIKHSTAATDLQED